MKKVVMVVMVMVLVVLSSSSVFAAQSQPVKSFRTAYGDQILMQITADDDGNAVATVRVAPGCFRTKGSVEGVRFIVNDNELQSLKDNMFVYRFIYTPETNMVAEITTGGITRQFSVTF